MVDLEGPSPTQDTFFPAIAEFKSTPDGEDPINWLIQNIPEYRSGSPDEPGEGYTTFEEVCASNIKNINFNGSIGSYTIFRYLSEEYKEKEAYVNGDFEQVHLRERIPVNIFWIDNIVLFQGSKTSVPPARNRLQAALLDYLRMRPLKLNPGIYRDLENLPRKHTHGIEVESIPSLSAESVSENVSKVSLDGNINSSSLKDYFPQHGKVSWLISNFRFYDYRIKVGISEDLIHVYSLTHLRRSIGEEEKNIVKMSFMKRLVEMAQSGSN